MEYLIHPHSVSPNSFFLKSYKIISYPYLLFSPLVELILFYVCACLYLFVMRAVIAVADGVTEEENAEEFGDQYREPEPEDPYCEQDFPEGLEDGKFNLIL